MSEGQSRETAWTDGMEHFDLIIIGAGSGNSVIGPEHDHLKIAIVERNLFGGTCLNVGCIPTKMYVHTANIAYESEHAAPFGLDITLDSVRWTDIRDRIFGRIDPIPPAGERYRRQLENWSVFDGTARFVGPKTIEVSHDATTSTITADQIIIATGASASIPDVPGLAHVRYETSDTIMRIASVPKRLVILGGGFIACEMAHIFGSLGAEVTILTRGPRLLARTDRSIAQAVTEQLSERFNVILECDTGRIDQAESGEIIVDARGRAVVGDMLLVATGRHPSTADLNLAAAGIVVDDDGYVVTNATMATNVAGVWALGDVTTNLQLKHVANAEARVVAHNIVNPDNLKTMDYSAVPYAVFTSPQVGTVGATEQELIRAGVPYRVVTQRYGDVAYGWAAEDTTSFAKLLADQTGERLLGAHIVGNHASILVQLLVQGMRLGSTILQMARGQLWIHPALSEVVENALLGLLEQGADDVIHPATNTDSETVGHHIPDTSAVREQP